MIEGGRIFITFIVAFIVAVDFIDLLLFYQLSE